MQILKKFKKELDLSTQIIIIVAIILVLNFLSYQIFKRFDLTENKIYSISKVSKEAVKNLDDIVNIKVYFSQDLPPQYLSVRQEVGDILEEYKNYADNKIKTEFINPKENEELQRELMILGIPQLQFNVFQNDRYEVINGYLGMAVYYGDKTEAIPVVNNTKDLEYQLTSAIKKLTAEKIPVLGFASGHGEKNRDEDLALSQKEISEIYQIRDVELSSGGLISDEINTLIFVGPQEEFNQSELYAIDQFLMSGRSAVFLIDGVTVDEELAAKKNSAGLNEILKSYGLEVEPVFVLDSSNEIASFNQGFLTFSTQYPFFTKVREPGFNKENAAVASLRELILPWASPITINESRAPEAEIQILARSTSEAWLMEDNFNLQPQGNFGFYNDPETYNLAAALFGKLNSAFDKKIVAAGEVEKEHLTSTEEAKIVLVGNSSFAADNFVRRYPDNLLFLQNLVDSVSLDGDLIKIRSKEINSRPLKEISEGAKKAVKYFNIFGVTAAVLIFGLIRYFTRRKSRFANEL